MAEKVSASKFRSKEDEERLARQKAKNPTNIKRAKELAGEYSGGITGSNVVSTKVTRKQPKWYSGTNPTNREVVARIYSLTSNNEEKRNELLGMYAENAQNSGHILYNPYSQPTNYKAVDGLKALGIDVPDKITSEWIASMQQQYANQKRTTATGYNAAAPTKTSTDAEEIAYWLKELTDAESKTSLAETQLQDMYNNVAYLAGKGYSDEEIVKRVRADIPSKYGVLNDMDEERKNYGAVILNRAVDYMGDDTIYGMIWAARNEGGTGNYFNDAVNYTMRNGNMYKRDPKSEAARDPSNYEGFSPYATGGTLDSMNQKYGVNEFNQEWLDANRGMLNDPDPEKAKDWRTIETGVRNSDQAASELNGLNLWLDKKLASGATTEDIWKELDAALKGEEPLTYREEGEDGVSKRKEFKPSTLAKMEEARSRGEAYNLGYGVDFNLPAYKDMIAQKVTERDEQAAIAAEEEAKRKEVENFGSKTGRFFASMGIGIGSYGDAIDSVKKARKKTNTEDEFAKKFIDNVLDIDFTGELTPEERAVVNNVWDLVDIATKNKATTEEIIAANDAIEELAVMFEQIANDPNRQAPVESYTDRDSWQSVVNPKVDDAYARGMVDLVADPVAYKPGEEQADPEAQRQEALNAYAEMCQGGEWNSDVINWAISQSSNPAGIRTEITQGIIDHVQKGAPLTGLAKSWWNKFGGLVDNRGVAGNAEVNGLTGVELLNYTDMHPESYDSRNAYGTAMYRALKMNEDAYNAGVLEDSEYADNLWALSAIADGIDRAAEGQRATDEVADAFLEESGYGMVLESMYQDINNVLIEKAEERGAKNAQKVQTNTEVINRAINGQMLEDDFPAYVEIVTADTSKVAAKDKTYQEASAYITDTIGFDAIAESGMQFTTGDKYVDATYESVELLNQGAALYSQGVTQLARGQLELHMKFAAASMMTLEEFYEKNPSIARTPEQLVAEAKEEYNGTWKTFGKTIDGLVKANEKITNPDSSEEEKPGVTEASGMSLSLADSQGLAYDKVAGIGSLNFAKTTYTMMYGWRDEAQEQQMMLDKYGGREGFAAEWDKVIAEREAELRNTYEHSGDKIINGMTYEEWRSKNSDPVLDEVYAKLDTSKDILELGDPARVQKEQEIAEKTAYIAGIDKTVAEYGSDFDKWVYENVTMLMQTGKFMYTTTMLGGGYVGSLASMFTSSYGDAYDRFMQSGDYDSAMLASTAAWLVNAAIEKMSYDRFMPENLGGKRGIRMAKVQSMLAREGMYSILKDPTKLSQAAVAVMEGVATYGISAGSEGLEEYLQQIVDSLADNFVYGTDYLLSGEQMATAGKAFWSGATMGALLNGVTNSMFGRPKVTNRAGEAITKAEAELLPETEGTKLNEAIAFEAANMAYVNSAEELAKIENSAENAAKKKAEQDLEAANTELADAQKEQAVAKEQRSAAALELEEVNIEMQDQDAFTEDMSKRMVAAGEALTNADKALADANARVDAAAANQANLQKVLDAAKAKVQQMYDTLMDEAKAKYAKIVTDKYYEGDTPEQRAAGEAYQSACKNLEDAKNLLLKAKAAADQQGGDTNIEYGKALLGVDRAAEAVEDAKAEMEAAYANAVEQEQNTVSEALTSAQQAAEQARAEAEADPNNSQKQLAAQRAQAQANTIRAKQELENRRAELSTRLKSADNTEREGAVADWKELQQAVTDAEAELEVLEDEFNETNTQANLRNALDTFKQYTNEQLLFEDEEGHEDAVVAYNNLQLAKADAEVANRMAELDKTEKGTADYDTALKAYNEALASRENEIGSQMGVDGDTVREMMRKAPESAQIKDAVGMGNYKHAATLMNSLLKNNTDRRAELVKLSTLENVDQASNSEIAQNLVSQLETRKDNAAEITQLLDTYSEQMWKDPRAAARTGKQTTATSNPIEIMRSLTRSLNTNYVPGGKVPRSVLGFYDQRANTIGVSTKEAGDLAVGLHEFGHAVQARLPGLEANERMINALSDDVRKAYDHAELADEAMSEFIVNYVFDPESAAKIAGADFVKEFEKQLKQDKTLYKAIKDASHKVELWNNSDPGSKARAMTKDSYNPERLQIGNKLSGILRHTQTTYLDKTAPADLVSRNFRKQVLYNTYANKRSDVVLSQWLTDPKTNKKIGKSLAERLYDAGVTENDMDAISDFALARHALARRAQNKDVFDQHEFTTEELEEIVAEYEGTEIEAGADALTEFWNDFADAWLVGTGLIEQETLDNMRKMYPNYVPTYRVVDKSFNTAPYGGESSVFKLRSAVEGGSSLEVINPMVSLATQVQKVVNTVSRNQMMQALHKELRKGSLPDVVKLVEKEDAESRKDISSAMSALEAVQKNGVSDPESMENLINELNGLALRFMGEDGGVGKNTVTGIDEYGNRFYYDVLDPDLYNLLSNNFKSAIIVHKVFRGIQNTFTSLTTSSNPFFAIKNMQRDFQASVNTGTWALTYADGMVKWVQAFKEVLEQSESYKEWRAMGGSTHARYQSAMISKDAGKLSADIAKAVLRGKTNRKGEFKVDRTALDKISQVITFEALNGAIEDASRFVEWRFGKHDLTTAEGRVEAFMRTQDVTTNFGSSPASAALVNMSTFIPFMNATIQGLNKDITMIGDLLYSNDASARAEAKKKMGKVLMNTALTAGMQFIILKMLGKGKEDDEDYALLNDAMKAGNVIVPIPKGLFEGLQNFSGFNKPYIRIPIAQGPLHQGLYAAALDIIGNTANYSPMEIDLLSALGSIMIDSIPTDGTIFQAVIDAYNNRTWYGGEIESSYMQDMSKYNRYSEDTPEAVIEFARFLKVSPAKLNYVFNQYGGAISKVIMPLLGSGSISDRGKALFNSILSNYTIDPTSSNDLGNEFDVAMTVLQQTVTEGERNLPLGHIAYGVDPDTALSEAEDLLDLFTSNEVDIKALCSERREVKNGEGMDDGEKARTMRDIRRNQINPLYEEALAEYEIFKAKYVKNDIMFNEVFDSILDLLGSQERPTIS